jgi:putative transcriptional regulator
MIKCNLSTLLGERKLKISDVARGTGLNRSTITLLYQDTANRIDLKAVEKICLFLKCDISDLFEIIPDDTQPLTKQKKRPSTPL